VMRESGALHSSGRQSRRGRVFYRVAGSGRSSECQIWLCDCLASLLKSCPRACYNVVLGLKACFCGFLGSRRIFLSRGARPSWAIQARSRAGSGGLKWAPVACRCRAACPMYETFGGLASDNSHYDKRAPIVSRGLRALVRLCLYHRRESTIYSVFGRPGWAHRPRGSHRVLTLIASRVSWEFHAIVAAF
jgi:hypothetical protein